jgi:hypothetical protein
VETDSLLLGSLWQYRHSGRNCTYCRLGSGHPRRRLCHHADSGTVFFPSRCSLITFSIPDMISLNPRPLAAVGPTRASASRKRYSDTTYPCLHDCLLLSAVHIMAVGKVIKPGCAATLSHNNHPYSLPITSYPLYTTLETCLDTSHSPSGVPVNRAALSSMACSRSRLPSLTLR